MSKLRPYFLMFNYSHLLVQMFSPKICLIVQNVHCEHPRNVRKKTTAAFAFHSTKFFFYCFKLSHRYSKKKKKNQEVRQKCRYYMCSLQICWLNRSILEILVYSRSFFETNRVFKLAFKNSLSAFYGLVNWL